MNSWKSYAVELRVEPVAQEVGQLELLGLSLGLGLGLGLGFPINRRQAP